MKTTIAYPTSSSLSFLVHLRLTLFLDIVAGHFKDVTFLDFKYTLNLIYFLVALKGNILWFLLIKPSAILHGLLAKYTAQRTHSTTMRDGQVQALI